MARRAGARSKLGSSPVRVSPRRAVTTTSASPSASTSTPRPSLHGPLSTADLLALQRHAGNAAVTSALGKGRPVVVQRFGGGTVVDVLMYAGFSSLIQMGVNLAVRMATSDDPEMAVLETLVEGGVTDQDKLANVVFLIRYPARMGAPLQKSEKKLRAEWRKIKRTKVRAALGIGPGPMSEATKASYIEKAKAQVNEATEINRVKLLEALPEGTSLNDWFAGIEPGATFLGLHIRQSESASPGVHKEMRERLDKAAEHLRAMDKFKDKNDKQIRDALGITEVGGLRRPKLASGSKKDLSPHCWGMAVDVNPKTNPFVGREKADEKKGGDPESETAKVINRAVWLMRGEVLEVEKPLMNGKEKLGALESWKLHRAASDDLVAYLALADDLDGETLKARVAAVSDLGDKKGIDWWKERIKKDVKATTGFDFGKHAKPKEVGYMDLTEDLIVAMNAAGLTWGGTYRFAKDIQHFDWRGGSMQRPGD